MHMASRSLRAIVTSPRSILITLEGDHSNISPSSLWVVYRCSRSWRSQERRRREAVKAERRSSGAMGVNLDISRFTDVFGLRWVKSSWHARAPEDIRTSGARYRGSGVVGRRGHRAGLA